jgi:hypothetical protein
VFMHAIKLSRRHLVGVASLTCSFAFAGLTFASLPAGAQTMPVTQANSSCPILSVSNPNPADTLPQGGYNISGTAYDPAATTGSGIARVDFFLGARDDGGTPLGSVVPGNVVGGDARAFSVQVQVPGINRGVDFAAYAVSNTGQETVVTFPVLVGTPVRDSVATPTPIPTTETVTSTCPKGPGMATAPTAAAPPAAGAPVMAGAPVVAVPAAGAVTIGATSPSTTTAAASTANACPVLSVSNPSPADTLNQGGYFISGTAYDPAATAGSGIARVDLFLGARDEGGTPLGSAIVGDGANPRAFNIEVQVPGINRGVDFAAYAISAVTGQETVITFPVFVGTPPAKSSSATPTPIPTTETITTTCKA